MWEILADRELKNSGNVKGFKHRGIVALIDEDDKPVNNNKNDGFWFLLILNFGFDREQMFALHFFFGHNP